MKVFVTGATGFVGAAVVRELLSAGHDVAGLARSADSAKALASKGASPVIGSIEDLDRLKRAAEDADGVVHTAFFHGFSQPGLATRLRVMFGGSPSGIVGRFMSAAVDADRRAIEAFGSVLRGRDRPLVVAFPTMAMRQGKIADEEDFADPHAAGGVRARSEQAALALSFRGLRTCVVRLPPSVHDKTKLGLVSQLAVIARKKGVSAYIGDGANRWGAVHRLDAARLFRLALEGGEAGHRYHALAETMPFRAIAEAIGSDLGVPVRGISFEAAKRHFGWLAPFVAADNPVSSHKTQERLSWRPDHAALLPDLAAHLRGPVH
jgi:nucleoside-diphosphate-sugar epimerase